MTIEKRNLKVYIRIIDRMEYLKVKSRANYMKVGVDLYISNQFYLIR